MNITSTQRVGGLVLTAWLTGVGSLSAGVHIGDSHESVIAELGRPDGYIETETTDWLYYERGTVKLEDGRVVEADLITAEQARERRAREREEWERRRSLWAERQAKHLREGWELKQSRQSNPRFLSSPASQQVAFWRTFRARYPEIPIHEEYALALERYQDEWQNAQRERDRERRIAELEERLRRAEDRAMARSYSGVRHNAFYSAPNVVFVQRHPQWVRSTKPVTLIQGVPAQKRSRPIAHSYADRVFGPFPARHAPGYHTFHRSSGVSGSVRVSF